MTCPPSGWGAWGRALNNDFRVLSANPRWSPARSIECTVNVIHSLNFRSGLVCGWQPNQLLSIHLEGTRPVHGLYVPWFFSRDFGDFPPRMISAPRKHLATNEGWLWKL